jgi:mono/diheme cytochrome c family protein
MKRLIRSIAAGFAVGGLVAFALSCGERPPTPPPGLGETQLAGWNAYVNLNCGSCHGEARQGKRSGPTLVDLDEHWTAEQLTSYLADPQAVIKTNPRLAYKAENYPIDMPGYAEKADTTTLQALAEYLLVDVD